MSIARLGFLGYGNMGRAIAEGFVNAGVIESDGLYVTAPNKEKLARSLSGMNANICADYAEVFKAADVILLCFKPANLPDAVKEFKRLGDLLRDKTFISIIAGLDYEAFTDAMKAAGLGSMTVKYQYIMPNVCASISRGVYLFEDCTDVSMDTLADIKEMFGAIGLVEVLASRLMKAGMAISGCGPAFVQMFIEAYADAAVKYGIPRDKAYRLVEETVIGSTMLTEQTGKHPGVIKDEVCSPGGTTIRGVAALEEAGLRDACIKSVDAIMR